MLYFVWLSWFCIYSIGFGGSVVCIKLIVVLFRGCWLKVLDRVGRIRDGVGVCLEGVIFKGKGFVCMLIVFDLFLCM